MTTTATAITPQITRNALAIVLGDDDRFALDLSALATLSQSEVASCFRRRALELHPDRAGALGVAPERLERAFKRLHGAYRVLSRLVEDDVLRRRVIEADLRSSGPRGRPDIWTPRASAAERPARPDRAKPHARPFSADGSTDPPRFYNGRVPDGELRFAQFLYYNRVIDWKTMIDAITWQHRVRPKVGEIGRSYRFLDFDAVKRVLRVSPRGELFGSTAMRLGLLDKRQLYVVLGKQYQLNYPIGRYFLEHDILSRPEIDHLLDQNRRHNTRFRDR